MDEELRSFAADIGDRGPVTVRGGGTRGDLGGPLADGVREVHAPVGVSDLRPRELVVVAGAGTPLAQLESELATVDQHLGFAAPPGSTVGGAVSCGRTGLHARALGPLRDVVLGVRAVDSWGRTVSAGGATVKNVSGFDLCRLWTGSLGTLALLGELTLRTRPRWAATCWLRGEADPFEVDRLAPDATSVLWDGREVWVHLAGHPDDLDAAAGLLGAAGCATPAGGPPALPAHRRSNDPASLASLTPDSHGGFVAEVGVGVVHTVESPAPVRMPRRLWELHREVKRRFDPTGRLNPGRSPLHDVAVQR